MRGLAFGKAYIAQNLWCVGNTHVSVPLRGLAFGKGLRGILRRIELSVSVPLRGLAFGKVLSGLMSAQSATTRVSVPLRGLAFGKADASDIQVKRIQD